jgi:hypothetical protein
MRLIRVTIHIVTETILINSRQGSLHAVNPSDKSHDCEQLINVKLPTLNTVDLTITDKHLLRHNNGRDSLADNSILDRPNGNSSLPRKVMQHENGVSSANRLSQLQPKNLVPCPFLRKRGYCLKVSRRDFLLNEVQPQGAALNSNKFLLVPTRPHMLRPHMFIIKLPFPINQIVLPR